MSPLFHCLCALFVGEDTCQYYLQNIPDLPTSFHLLSPHAIASHHRLHPGRVHGPPHWLFYSCPCSLSPRPHNSLFFIQQPEFLFKQKPCYVMSLLALSDADELPISSCILENSLWYRLAHFFSASVTLSVFSLCFSYHRLLYVLENRKLIPA